MKKRREEHAGGQDWLNTYADMITLVLTFFVLLYSISNVNMTKLEAVAEAMQKKLGIEVQVKPSEEEIADMDIAMEQPALSSDASSLEMAKLARDIQSYFETENLDASVTSKENAVYIRFKNDPLFDPDSAVLREGSKDMLDAVGMMLLEKQNDIMAIYINGHTAQAANSLINDRLLSSERADRVAIYLEEQAGLEPEKLICRGYGKYYPIADNSTKEGREQNRRVDMIILGNDFKTSENEMESVDVVDPLFPVGMPEDMNADNEGAAQ